MLVKRKSGILLHITSLPGKFGIGGLGREAYEFVDFLSEAGQKIWQILPTGPTGYGDSPYQTFSAFAGNPWLIDPQSLVALGLISRNDKAEMELEPETSRIDYGKIIAIKNNILRNAWQNFTPDNDYKIFREKNSFWLDDFSLFMSIKQHFGGTSWLDWEKDIKLAKSETVKRYRDLLKKDIEYYNFQQYIFFKQWFELKKYAESKSISVMGDLTIFVAMDSSDVWSDNKLFLFDDKQFPLLVAGVPPDYFSETGQLWGNPIYNWDNMVESDFKWWVQRMRLSLEMFELLRVDHFRGFAGYWAIPFGEKTAVKGNWLSAPGMKLFSKLQNEFTKLPIIAEDLGVITDDVIELRDKFNLPGMKVLQFAFDSGMDNPFLPHNYKENFAVYTGTHDNDTCRSWFEKLDPGRKNFVRKYIGCNLENVSWKMIETAWKSPANLAIAPMQDFLNLDSSARMNTPGKTGGNWQWKLTSGQLDSELARRIKRITTKYLR